MPIYKKTSPAGLVFFSGGERGIMAQFMQYSHPDFICF